jgi:hypothetical protein
MEIAYAAHTESCTFLLDGDGICRFVTTAPARGMLPVRARHADAGARGSDGAGRVPDHADRCIGAQYVASIDLGAKGGLVELPRPGAPLVFARIEADGRIALVRSGPLVRFEPLSAGGSGVRARPQAVDAPRDARRDSAPTPVAAAPRPRSSAPPRTSEQAPARSSQPPAPARTSQAPAQARTSTAPSARPSAPSAGHDASDEERTSPYRPSNGTLAASRRAPSIATRPSRTDDGAARPSPLPRLPGPPRVPQGMARPATRSVIPPVVAHVAAGVARLPVPRPSRTPPPPPPCAPTRPRRPSILRAAVTPARDPMRTLEPDGDDGITVPQRRAR